MEKKPPKSYRWDTATAARIDALRTRITPGVTLTATDVIKYLVAKESAKHGVNGAAPKPARPRSRR